jgi:hypothetical protein
VQQSVIDSRVGSIRARRLQMRLCCAILVLIRRADGLSVLQKGKAAASTLPKYGRCLTATQPIKEADTILKIPQDACLTLAPGEPYPFETGGEPGLHEHYMTHRAPFTRLALKLLWLKEQPSNTAWSEYFAALPDVSSLDDAPGLWKQSEFAALRYVPVQRSLQRQRTAWLTVSYEMFLKFLHSLSCLGVAGGTQVRQHLCDLCCSGCT